MLVHFFASLHDESMRKCFTETPVLAVGFLLLIETYILLYFLNFNFTIYIAQQMLDNFSNVFLLLPRANKMHLYFSTVGREIATGAIIFCLFLFGIYMAIVSFFDIQRFKSHPIKFSKKNVVSYGIGIIISIAVSIAFLLHYDVNEEYFVVKEKDIPFHSIGMTKEILVYFLLFNLLRSSILGFLSLQEISDYEY